MHFHVDKYHKDEQFIVHSIILYTLRCNLQYISCSQLRETFENEQEIAYELKAQVIEVHSMCC